MRKQYSATFKAEAVKALLKEDKTLSFGERKMLDTAKNLLVKELSLVNNSNEDDIEAELLALLEAGE